MAAARFLIFASESYEPLPLTIVEAFSRGTPVLAANLESIDELVKDGVTGLRFKVGDAADLAAKANRLLADAPSDGEVRRNCRSVYEQRYTESLNYRMLSAIYSQAIQMKRNQAAIELENLRAMSGMNSSNGEEL
jgi:glycosyltransferase involved in cell wall biosynthesis